MGRSIQLGSKRAKSARTIAKNLFERFGRPVLLSELIAEIEANHNNVVSADSVGSLFRANYFQGMVVANDFKKEVNVKLPVGSDDCNKSHHIPVSLVEISLVEIQSDEMEEVPKIPIWTMEERQAAFERMKRREPYTSRKPEHSKLLWGLFWLIGIGDVVWLIWLIAVK